MFLHFAFGEPSKWREKENSPQFLVPAKGGSAFPPWLVIHAPKDSLVSTIQAQNFTDHLKSLSIPVQLFQDLEGDHFDAVHSLESDKETVLGNLILQFIHSVCNNEEE